MKIASITSKFKGTRSRKEVLVLIEEIEALRSKRGPDVDEKMDDRLLAVVEALKWTVLKKNWVEHWMKHRGGQ